MNSSIRLISILAFTIAIAGCSQAAGSVGASPTASLAPVPSSAPSESAEPLSAIPSASPSPSPTAASVSTPSPTDPPVDPATVFAANGIGPYVVGARLASLEAQDLVSDVEPSFHCDDEWQNAQATGRYAGHLHLSFFLGRLTDVHAGSDEFVTPSGARVGMSLAELRDIYGKRGSLIDDNSAFQAFSVHVPDTALGIVFFLDESNTKVRSMSAGQVERLDVAAVVGEGC
jgi:hypothetical protein